MFRFVTSVAPEGVYPSSRPTRRLGLPDGNSDAKEERMKKELRKKLSLNRETVRHLTREESLVEVAGGTTGSLPSKPVSLCLGTCVFTSCGTAETNCDC